MAQDVALAKALAQPEEEKFAKPRSAATPLHRQSGMIAQ
jgi:hypothetical protein